MKLLPLLMILILPSTVLAGADREVVSNDIVHHPCRVANIIQYIIHLDRSIKLYLTIIFPRGLCRWMARKERAGVPRHRRHLKRPP
jgi:hypothetical protein